MLKAHNCLTSASKHVPKLRAHASKNDPHLIFTKSLSMKKFESIVFIDPR